MESPPSRRRPKEANNHMSDVASDSTALALVPPAAVPAVTDDQAAAQAQQIDATVVQYVNTLMSADPHSPAFDQQLNAVHSLGDADIRASAAVPFVDPAGASRHGLGRGRTAQQADCGRNRNE